MTVVTETRVLICWAEVTGHEVRKISLETKLRSFDDVDSLDLAEFFMCVEEEFRVELPDHLCSAFITLGDVAAHVDRELAKK